METTKYIQTYNHQNRIGVVVEFYVQTSVPTMSEGFINFTKGIAMQIAANNPEDVVELLNQKYLLDETILVSDELEHISKLVNESLKINRFLRWDVETTYHPTHTPEPPDKNPAVAMRVINESNKGY